MKIIFALGNPDKKYALTRHNIGFTTIDAVTQVFNASWTETPKFKALIASTTINNEKILLVKPTTYYNEVGEAARKIVDFYTIDVKNDFLVIHDDLVLPFGTIRVRNTGQDAGNNGIKSLNAHLGTVYSRIRVGTNDKIYQKMNDTNFVLSKLTFNERRKLKTALIPKINEIIDDFIADNVKNTSYKLF